MNAGVCPICGKDMRNADTLVKMEVAGLAHWDCISEKQQEGRIKIRFFHIGDMLSVTTGILMSDRHMEGVEDLLKFLTDDPLLTGTGLYGMKPLASTFLTDLYPRLKESEIDTSLYLAELEQLKARGGSLDGDSKEANFITRQWLWKFVDEVGKVWFPVMRLKDQNVPNGVAIIRGIFLPGNY